MELQSRITKVPTLSNTLFCKVTFGHFEFSRDRTVVMSSCFFSSLAFCASVCSRSPRDSAIPPAGTAGRGVVTSSLADLSRRSRSRPTLPSDCNRRSSLERNSKGISQIKIRPLKKYLTFSGVQSWLCRRLSDFLI